jgi:hypothetical protein
LRSRARPKKEPSASFPQHKEAADALKSPADAQGFFVSPSRFAIDIVTHQPKHQERSTGMNSSLPNIACRADFAQLAAVRL